MNNQGAIPSQNCRALSSLAYLTPDLVFTGRATTAMTSHLTITCKTRRWNRCYLPVHRNGFRVQSALSVQFKPILIIYTTQTHDIETGVNDWFWTDGQEVGLTDGLTEVGDVNWTIFKQTQSSTVEMYLCADLHDHLTSGSWNHFVVYSFQINKTLHQYKVVIVWMQWAG